MTELDTELIPEVYEIIEEFGKTVVLTDSRATSFGVDGTPVVSTTTQTRKITPPDPTWLKYISDDVTKANQTGAFVSAKDLTVIPKPGVKVTIDGVIFTVIQSNPIYSGELVCLYGMKLEH